MCCHHEQLFVYAWLGVKNAFKCLFYYSEYFPWFWPLLYKKLVIFFRMFCARSERVWLLVLSALAQMVFCLSWSAVITITSLNNWCQYYDPFTDINADIHVLSMILGDCHLAWVMIIVRLRCFAIIMHPYPMNPVHDGLHAYSCADLYNLWCFSFRANHFPSSPPTSRPASEEEEEGSSPQGTHRRAASEVPVSPWNQSWSVKYYTSHFMCCTVIRFGSLGGIFCGVSRWFGRQESKEVSSECG